MCSSHLKKNHTWFVLQLVPLVQHTVLKAVVPYSTRYYSTWQHLTVHGTLAHSSTLQHMVLYIAHGSTLQYTVLQHMVAPYSTWYYSTRQHLTAHGTIAHGSTLQDSRIDFLLGVSQNFTTLMVSSSKESLVFLVVLRVFPRALYNRGKGFTTKDRPSAHHQSGDDLNSFHLLGLLNKATVLKAVETSLQVSNLSCFFFQTQKQIIY